MILFGIAATYTALVTGLCQLRFENFYGGTFDLGVNEQLLWTGSHGRLLYETPDLLTTGIHSFLEIHSTYLAFLVAPLYSALPYPGTLFAIESAAVASTVFPMYLIARSRGLTLSLIIPLLVLFLASFAILSALLYDFHWEAFLPSELLWFYFLVRRRSYLLAGLPMILGFLTLEIFPVLVGGVVLLFLVEKVHEIGLRPRALIHDYDVQVQLVFAVLAGIAYGSFLLLEHLVIPNLVGTSGVTGVYTGVNPSYAVLATPSSLAVSAVYWVLLLASFGFVPFLSPKSLLPTLPWFVESVVLQPYYSTAFGNQYALIAIATLSVAYVEGFAQLNRKAADPLRSLLAGSGLALSAGIANVLAFSSSETLLAVRSARRFLMNLALPICILMVLSITLFSVLLAVRPEPPSRGRQVGRPLIGPNTADMVFLAAVVALCSIFLFDFLCLLLPYPAYLAPPFVWLTFVVLPLCAAGLVLVGHLKVAPGTRKETLSVASQPRPSLRLRRPLWAATVVLIVGFNLAMSPLNPANFEASGRGGYELRLAPNPISGDMGWIVSQMPLNSVVLATTDLFPFAADNPNAWPALNLCLNDTCPPPYLPFTASHLPHFVLADSLQWVMLPTFVQNALLNTSTYGLEAEIYSADSPTGSVYLFGLGFHGTPQYRYGTSLSAPYFGTATNLIVGPSGSVIPDGQSQFGNGIESRENRSVLGNQSLLWGSDAVYPLAGLYVVTYSLMGTSRYASVHPETPVLELNLLPSYDGPSPPYFSTTITAGELTSTGWSQYRFLVAFEGPFQMFETQGFLCYTLGEPNANVILNYVEVAPY